MQATGVTGIDQRRCSSAARSSRAAVKAAKAGRIALIGASDVHQLRSALAARGYARDVEWSERVQPPTNEDDFAAAIILVIVNSGMKNAIAERILTRVMDALVDGASAASQFGHRGKAAAIDFVWRNRGKLFAEFLRCDDPLAFIEELPWVGPITKWHVAKNFGIDCAKPDVHLERLATAEGTSVAELCARLSRETGLRIATIDMILWRACSIGLLDSRAIAGRAAGGPAMAPSYAMEGQAEPERVVGVYGLP